jgi:hypothetical protein
VRVAGRQKGEWADVMAQGTESLKKADGKLGRAESRLFYSRLFFTNERGVGTGLGHNGAAFEMQKESPVSPCRRSDVRMRLFCRACDLEKSLPRPVEMNWGLQRKGNDFWLIWRLKL